MKKANKLINEKSPYLLQHAYNPVNWYPWSDEAFLKARTYNRPIFLSIGYSTCHWCHVMEKESFEDEEIAKILNEHFVSIKVDREERPDVDMIYMNFCMMLTGSGGWPLTIFMTPDKKPFYAGTYFPKENKYGRIGLKELLLKIVELWQNDNKSILESSEKIFQIIKDTSKNISTTEKFEQEVIHNAFNTFRNRYDNINGGFGESPKFPTPHNYIFLLRYYHNTGNKLALEMVEYSATKMRLGGIYDHIGFGFHRYSTDEKWLVPHFEKMLYDQALLSIMYIELYQITKNELYRKTAEEIFDYILRDMTSPEGAFYSAEDADSEGVEGKFYLWKYSEVKEILGPDANKFINIYNITENGNFQSQLHNPGENIIYLKKTLEEINLDEDLSLTEIEKMRKLLFEYRKKRVPPIKDDKILTDWNGLMIAALALGYRVFNADKYLHSAVSATEFILTNMLNKNGILYHRYREKETGIGGNLDDYSYFIWGLLELYQSNLEVKYLEKAIEFQDIQIQYFWDKVNFGFYFTSQNSNNDLIIRPKVFHDNATPSGNSISLYNLLRLYHITGNNDYFKLSQQLLRACADEVNSNPYYYSMLLTSYMYSISSPQEIVIVGERNETEKILKVINKKYNPNRIIILKSAGTNLIKLAPYVKEMVEIQNKPTVYICQNFTCKLPINSLEEIEKNL